MSVNYSHFRKPVMMQAIREAREMIADYEAECESYYAEGHSPRYCIHGTNRWTDYDNICWGCEESIFTAYDFAKMWVPGRLREIESAFIMYESAREIHAPQSVQDSLFDWMLELSKKYMPVRVPTRRLASI